MNILTGLALMLIGIPQIIAVCLPNNICENERDTIIQLNSSVLPSEKLFNSGRAWSIQPRKKPFNAILAFKNFSSMMASVMVIAYTGVQERTIKYFYGNLTDFEVVSQNVISLVIYVPINKKDNAEFVLNYYTGCEVLSSASDQISSIPARFSSEGDQTKCWFIQPGDNEERKRIYFSARDVFLNTGQQLAIWDIHTMTVVAKAENGDEYELIATETDEHQSILIDLVCTVEYCNKKFNSYFISYYAMTQEDIACIQVQKQCDERDDIPREQCDITCPAFDNMVIEEYGLRLQETVPRLRSARIQMPAIDDPSLSEGAPPVMEEETVMEEVAVVMEEETTEMEDTSDTENEAPVTPSNEVTTPEEGMATTTRPRRRRRRCPLPKPFCRCKRTFDENAFCGADVFCLGCDFPYDNCCRLACIRQKIFCWLQAVTLI